MLNNEGNPTGKIMKKNEQIFFDKNFYNLGPEVWIINSDNKILIQKRSKQKRYFPMYGL